MLRLSLRPNDLQVGKDQRWSTGGAGSGGQAGDCDGVLQQVPRSPRFLSALQHVWRKCGHSRSFPCPRLPSLIKHTKLSHSCPSSIQNSHTAVHQAYKTLTQLSIKHTKLSHSCPSSIQNSHTAVHLTYKTVIKYIKPSHTAVHLTVSSSMRTCPTQLSIYHTKLASSIQLCLTRMSV